MKNGVKKGKEDIKMKVIMTGGGTGGHIYPAIAIADKIKEEDPEAEILFVGTKRGLEKTLVPKNGYPIKFITVSGFNRKNMLKNFRTAVDLMKGNLEAKAILKEFKPDIVIGTGGYVCGPMVRAAKKWGASTYIHEQNAFPGVTNKLLEKYVDKVFISFSAAEEYFKEKDKLVFSGNPVREVFYKIRKEAARTELGIDRDKFVILSFGGSQGAGRINDAMFSVAEALSGRQDIQLLFATGKYYYQSVLDKAQERNLPLRGNVRILEYIDNMDKYIAASDLIISRAGALTVSEITVCGKPSILIPSPNVTGNHQFFNAKAVADIGGAVLIEEKELTDELLFGQIMHLINNRSELEKMSTASRKAAPPKATDIIYRNLQ